MYHKGGTRLLYQYSNETTDWAIAFNEGVVKHVYFVAETKGVTKFEMKSVNLRGVEEFKIDCARKHFESISGGNLKFDIVSSYAELSELLTK